MAKKNSSDLTLQEQAAEILEKAKARGVQSNFFFITTFKRYQVQMQIMSELEKQITELGPVVTKEYVKGRQNVCTNPAISEYNKTATAANNTVSTLIKIVESIPQDNGQKTLAEELNELMSGMA